MPPTALQNMKNQRSKFVQLRNEFAIFLARIQQDIETLKWYKMKIEMTGTCCQRLQYVAVLEALKKGLGNMEKRVEHVKEMDLKCVAHLEEVEKALSQYTTLDTEEQSIWEY